MTNFEPKGEKPIWKFIYDYVAELPIGTFVSFDELSEEIGEDFLRQRTALYKANKMLVKDKQRILSSIRGKGYKIEEGLEHLRHAENRHERAEKQVKLANFEALNINTKTMSFEEKQRWSQFLAWNGTVLAALSHNTERIAKAGVVAKIATDNVMEELTELRNQLDGFASQMEDMQEKLV